MCILSLLSLQVMPTGRVHNGVASSYLQQCRVGERIPVFIRHSTFKLPASPSAPVVMVGPGTGLAPFRGFIQERESMLSDKQQLGPAVLFFGCRHRNHDYIYEAELNAAVETGALSKLHVAFSRMGAQKDYVQHHMEAQAGGLRAEAPGRQGRACQGSACTPAAVAAQGRMSCSCLICTSWDTVQGCLHGLFVSKSICTAISFLPWPQQWKG